MGNFPDIQTYPPESRRERERHRHHSEVQFVGGILAMTVLFAVTCWWMLWKNDETKPKITVKETAPVRPEVLDENRIKLESISLEPVSITTHTPKPDYGDISRYVDSPFTSATPVIPQNQIDELVFAKWEELQIVHAELCSDAVFLRRIFIDVLGTLPTVSEAKTFLDNTDPQKRQRLIDEVLERPEFADYLAMKWGDILRIKAEFPIKLWPQAAQAYHRWIRTSIDENLPYDQFVKELLTSSGSNFRKPQVNFYRAAQSKDPKALAQMVALSFLAERTDRWPEEKLENMSLFFSKVGYKPTGEWKEEIVFFDRRKQLESPQSTVMNAEFPDGNSIEIPRDQDPREVFADWLVQPDNPRLARALVNRVWYWLLGRGIINPVDDIRADNPPSNPALLNHLAKEFIAAQYDVKHLYRSILNSHTYQLSCLPKSNHPLAGEQFAYYHVRRMDAEVLIDGICQISGVPERYSSIIPEPFTFLPDGQRAISLPDGSITSSFLEMFGRPSRDTGLESDRNNRLSAAQSLHLLNSNHIRNKLKTGPGIKAILRESWGSLTNDADGIYLAILSRRPTDEERYSVSGLASNEGGARDIAWVLINSDEFLFRH